MKEVEKMSKDQNEAEVEKLSNGMNELDILCFDYGDARSTAKDQNEVEAIIIPAKPSKEDVRFVLFGETKCLYKNFWGSRYDLFVGVLTDEEDATIGRLHYIPKHEFELRAKVSRPLSNLKHVNVIELVIYNLDGLDQVLAYDFASLGSLHDILHEQQGIGSSSKPYPALSWSQRIQIPLGVAKGSCYIHDMGLIHHNIRSSSIFVCDDETAKIIDPFLWTRWLQCGPKASVSERHPMVFHNFSENNDVYNFGEVLLELLTGNNTRQRARQRQLVSRVCSTATTSF